MNIPTYGSVFTSENAHFNTLKVRARSIPEMTVYVEEGGIWFDKDTYSECIGAPSPVVTAPIIVGHARWVYICFHRSAEIRILEGTTAVDPVVPIVPTDYIPLAVVYVTQLDTSINKEMIFDIRPIFAGAAFSMNHSDLPDVTSPSRHPISAISGLQTILDSKCEVSVHTADMATKAGVGGTPEIEFRLNSDATTASSDAYLMVERGSSLDVSIKWNETIDKWTATNDGTIFHLLQLGFSEVEFLATPPVSPGPGYMFFHTGTNQLRIYNGATWHVFDQD